MEVPCFVKEEECVEWRWLNVWLCCIDLWSYVFKLSFRSAMLDQWTAFTNLAPTLPTVHFSCWVTSLEAVYQIRHSSLWSHKKVVLLFHTCSRTCQNLYKYNLSSIWETSTHSNSPRSHRITVLLKCTRLSRLSMPRELICDFRMQVCILNARLTRRAVPPPGYDTEGINYHVFEGTI